MEELNFFKNKKLNKLTNDSYIKNVLSGGICKKCGNELKEDRISLPYGNIAVYLICVKCKTKKSIYCEYDNWWEYEYEKFEKVAKQLEIDDIIKQCKD